MKILSVCYEDMSGSIGGVRQVIEIGEHLMRRNHRVEVSVAGIGKYRQKTDLKINYVPTVNIRILRPLVYHLLSFFHILVTCLVFKPDIILTYEIFFSFTPLAIAKIIGRPHVLFVNGDIEDFKIKNYPGPALFFIDTLRKINLKFSTRIITVSEQLKEMICDKYQILSEKIDLVHNGVDITEFKPMDRNTACKKLGLNADTFHIGFLGGLFSWHGLDCLVRSAPLVLSRYPKTKFIIAGHGPMKEKLISLAEESKVKESFIFTAQVPFDLVPFYINSFDICIVFFKPVRKNSGNPVKMFEYLACAKPIVASKQGGYGDFVEELQAGQGVDIFNQKEVAQAIISLKENEQLRADMAERARKAAVDKYSWDKVVQMLEDVFSKLISK
ncbi:MAG: glycosyltransferase family 4 protein [Candidatus Omnitrophica bacterium]|nr:glycosyltransferase family 4 protein [Candidatus Omnitrophota bacterium]